jgi:hypothetical protein
MYQNNIWKLFFLFISLFLYGNSANCSNYFCCRDSILIQKIISIYEYANKYNPVSVFQEDTIIIAMPPSSDTLMAKTFNYVWVRDSLEVEKSIVIILLKLYKSHLICCHQSYDIRPNGEYSELTNPVFYYFTKFAKLPDFSKGNILDYINFGPITSNIIYDYVEKNRRLLETVLILFFNSVKHKSDHR